MYTYISSILDVLPHLGYHRALVEFPMVYSRSSLVTCFIHTSICQSQSPSSSPSPLPRLVSLHLFSISMSLFLPCKQIHLYHFSGFHVYAFSVKYLVFSFWLTSLCMTDSRSIKSETFEPVFRAGYKSQAVLATEGSTCHAFLGWLLQNLCVSLCKQNFLKLIIKEHFSLQTQETQLLLGFLGFFFFWYSHFGGCINREIVFIGPQLTINVLVKTWPFGMATLCTYLCV